MIKSTVFLLGLILAFNFCIGQSGQFEKQLKDSIIFYEQKLKARVPEKIQNHANERIIKLLTRLLKQENSIDINFDTLKIISVLSSDNKKLKVFSWVMIKPMGKYEYYGIVQAFDERSNQYKTTELKDKKIAISSSMKKTLTAEKWYGARYYKLITNKYKGRYSYTLLGWKGLDMTQNANVIEVIALKSNGTFTFGYNLFEIKDNEYFDNSFRPKRVIFAYSSEAHMNLNYQKQTILKKVKDGRIKRSRVKFGFSAQKKEVRTKPKYKKIVSEMIVFDELAPLNPEMTGMYAFYIPKINVLDAFYFESGKWVYYPDIDARNPTNGATRKEVIDYELIEEEIED